MKAAPEQYMVRNHPKLGSDATYGNNGFFVIPHHRIREYFFQCMISDGMGWQHVSVSLISKLRTVERCPTWEEMCYVKDLFWEKDEAVMQLHPPESEYVSNHHYCLHLWKPDNTVIPMPDSIMVGTKSPQKV
ncbi:MAG: hypothetical protein WKF88_05620 [Ferruginibacter sp.]